MPKYNDPQNPLVVNSNDSFTQLGYPTGGTPMPVNVLSGSLGAVNVGVLTDNLTAMRLGSNCNFATFSWNPTTGEFGTIIYRTAAAGNDLGTLSFSYTAGTLFTITRT